MIAEKVNFIRAYSQENIFDYMEMELYHDILRTVFSKEKIKIFLSHSKTDGEEIAKDIKLFIDSNTKLDTFFDVTDIQNSDDWEEKLKDEIDNSLFLFIYSDTYSSKEWTTKELIFAKKNHIPIIGIDVLSNEDRRVFPYIGNIKMLKLNYRDVKIERMCYEKYSINSKSNIQKIIISLLKEAIKHYLFKKQCKDNDEQLVLSKQPELFDICNGKQTIFYPDPPLSLIEEDILKSHNQDIKLITPILKHKINLNKNIAISISESQNLEKIGLKIEHLHIIMSEISRYLLIKNCKLYYGGDIAYKKEEFNFVKILVELLKTYNNDYKDEKKLYNYAVKPFSKFIDDSLKAKYKNLIDFQEIGEDCEFNNIIQVVENLTLMRKELTDIMDKKIAIGGKITGFSGFNPGVYEEIYLAVKAKKPIFLIGGFGGVVEKVIDLLNGKDIEELTFEYQSKNTEKLKLFLEKNPKFENKIKKEYQIMYDTLKGKKYFILNNDLNEEKNKILFESKNISEIIKILMERI